MHDALTLDILLVSNVVGTHVLNTFSNTKPFQCSSVMGDRYSGIYLKLVSARARQSVGCSATFVFRAVIFISTSPSHLSRGKVVVLDDSRAHITHFVSVVPCVQLHFWLEHAIHHILMISTCIMRQ